MQKENIELYKKWNDFETLFKKRYQTKLKKMIWNGMKK